VYNLRRISKTRVGSNDKGNEGKESRKGEIISQSLLIDNHKRLIGGEKLKKGIQQVPRKVVFPISSAYTPISHLVTQTNPFPPEKEWPPSDS